MFTIAVNENNDIFLDNADNLSLTSDIYAVADVCKNVVLTRLAELTLNTVKGIPYFETIFDNPPNIDVFQASIVEALNNVENVNRVLEFTYTVNNGIYAYTARIETIYGEIVLNG